MRTDVGGRNHSLTAGGGGRRVALGVSVEDAVKAIRNRHILSRAAGTARREGGGTEEKKEKKWSAVAASSQGHTWLPAGNAGGARSASQNALSGDYEGTSKERGRSPALQLRLLTLARYSLYWPYWYNSANTDAEGAASSLDAAGVGLGRRRNARYTRSLRPHTLGAEGLIH